MTEPGNSIEPRTPTANVRALVEEVVKMIVDHPEEVAVEETAGERGGAALNLRVAQTDVGKVIGKQGRTIRSLRNGRISETRMNSPFILAFSISFFSASSRAASRL